MKDENANACIPVEITEEDIVEAMKSISGYLDITTGDFKAVYQAAFNHAAQRLTEDVKVSDVMTSNVVTAESHTPLKEIAQLMSQMHVSGVPIVTEDRRVAGIVSEKDFLFYMAGVKKQTFMDVVATCLAGKQCLAVPIKAKMAGDIMTSPAIVVSEKESIFDAANLMSEKKINRLPVVDQEHRLAGIISRGDILTYPLPKAAL